MAAAEEIGVACAVVAPSLIPVRAGDRVETDRRDAKKLVSLYRAGMLRFVDPPTVEVWLEIVMLAHDLRVWKKALQLDGQLAKAEPTRLRYKLLHIAGRLAFSGRRAKLRLQHDWRSGPRARRRVRKAQNAPSRRRLTPATR